MIQEYRCQYDHKLLFKGILVEGRIEIKCKHCGDITTFEPAALADILCRKRDCPNRQS